MPAGILISDIASRLRGRIAAPLTDAKVYRLALPRDAGMSDLTFVGGPVSRADIARSDAAAALVAPGTEISPRGVTLITVDDPLLACARAAQWLPVSRNEIMRAGAPIIDPTAVVGEGCVIGAGAVVGADTVLGPWCEIGPGARIGEACELAGRVVVGAGVTLGNRVRVGAGAIAGSESFAWLRDGPCWIRLPMFAAVTIGDDASIGAQCVVASGVWSDTSLGRRVVLDAQVHVGHDSCVGDDTILAGGTTVAGGVNIGCRCVISGRAAIVDGVTIADEVRVDAMTLVTKTIRDRGERVCSAWPARRSRDWWRLLASWSASRRDG